MAVNDVISLRVVGRYQSQNIVNTLHYLISDQGSSEQNILAQICTGFNVDIATAWLAAHITAYELVGYKAFNHTGAAKTPAFLAIAQDGTRSGTPAPSSVCRTITLYTASAKHRRRGRVMLSGSIIEDFDADDGSVDAGGLAVLTTLAALLEQAITVTPDTFTPCIPPTAVDPVEAIIDAKARVTPSSITTRRIRQFLIG